MQGIQQVLPKPVVIALVLTIVVWCYGPVSLAAQTPIYGATGVTPVQGNDLAAARNAAYRSGVQIAVSSALTDRLGLSLNPVQIAKIYEDLQQVGGINARIIAEGVHESLYTIQLEVSLDAAKLEQQLTSLGLVSIPRVVILTEEYLNGKPIHVHPVASALTRTLSESGVRVIDQASLDDLTRRDTVRAAFAGDAQSAVALGTRFGADVLIVAQADTKPGGQLGTARSAQATVSIRGVWVATAGVAFDNIIRATGADFSFDGAGERALEAAGQDASTYALKRIKTPRAAHVQLVVRNVPTLEKLNAVLARILGIPGVMSAQIGTYDASTAIIDIDTILSVQNLSAAMDTGSGMPAITRIESTRLEGQLPTM